MRKILLIVLLFPFFCQGQNIYTDKVDDFTGIRIIKSFTTLIHEKPILRVETICYLGKLDNNQDTSFALQFYFETSSLTSTRNSKLYLKLENDEVIKIEYTGDYQIYNPTEIGVIHFSLSDSAIEKIIVSHVYKIRIETSNDLYDYALAGSFLTIIDQQISSIRNLLKIKK